MIEAERPGEAVSKRALSWEERADERYERSSPGRPYWKSVPMSANSGTAEEAILEEHADGRHERGYPGGNPERACRRAL